jgi:hypothetical protein
MLGSMGLEEMVRVGALWGAWQPAEQPENGPFPIQFLAFLPGPASSGSFHVVYFFLGHALHYR